MIKANFRSLISVSTSLLDLSILSTIKHLTKLRSKYHQIFIDRVIFKGCKLFLAHKCHFEINTVYLY